MDTTSSTSTTAVFPKIIRELFDVEQKVPLLDGTRGTYINFDNAASTPSFLSVQAAVNDFLPWYASVHRGAGYKSQLSTHAYETARAATMRFVGANSATHICIFGKNTTEAINKLARRFHFSEGRNIVLVSKMEHHSNDLPYRPMAKVIHVDVLANGELDEEDFDHKLQTYSGQIGLVAISGASNVTGWINPIHRLAEKTHAVGAQIIVDAAQLAPHRKIEMGMLEDPAHIDYITLSAHKMYAPFGTGALVGRRDTFETGDPDLRGGGEVELVTEDSVLWSAPPDRDEAGSPNVVGAVALAAAIRQLEVIGMDQVAEHEAELTHYALKKLGRIGGVHLFGMTDPERSNQRVGVIPFNLQGISHFLVAAILGYEFGIGVRNGCFCAHPYILHLLGVSNQAVDQVRQKMLAYDRRENPGLVRASFGLYNTTEEIDRFGDALQKIIRGEYCGRYKQDLASGDFVPTGWTPEFLKIFHL